MSEIEMKIDEAVKPLEKLCTKLVDLATAELDKNVECIDTHEMYEVVDMIKDLSEAKKSVTEMMYKKQIMTAMEEAEYGEDYDEDGPIRYYTQPRNSRGQYTSGRNGNMSGMRGRGRRGYTEPPYMHMDEDSMYEMSLDDYKSHDPEYWRKKDRMNGRMYYTEPNMNGMSTSGNRSESQMMRDTREGRAGMSRKKYYEDKMAHSTTSPEDKKAKMASLEYYIKDIGTDITEMLMDASPEEKTMAKQKIMAVANAL